jgi:predicted metal-dependent peptidase
VTRPRGPLAAVTLDPSHPELTAEQDAEARVWMQAARAWVIEHHPYLDTAVTAMVLVPRPGLGTVAVDARWRLYYDPARVLAIARQHGIEVLASDWIHETMHVLRDHHDRWDAMRHPPDRHPLFNIAADAFVNADCADLGLPLLDTDVTFERLPTEAACTRTMTTEEVYTRLTPFTETSHAPDCGSGTGGRQREWEESLSDDVDDGSPDAGQAEMIREETARNVAKAAAEAGTAPAALRAWAAALLDPVVDWRTEMRSVVSRRLGRAAGVTDYSFARLARRRIPGYTMPGMVGPAAPLVAAVVDTSGSMEAEELARCLGELLGLARAVNGDGAAITVVACDAEITGVHRIRTAGAIRALELSGGGGTDMRVGLDACAALRPAPEAVVVMTDGYTPWPVTPPASLRSALVIALVTDAQAAKHVPDWIRTISVA